MSLDTFVNRYLPALETEMRAVVRGADPRLNGLFGMLHYQLGWTDAAFSPCRAQTGKRVRPILCLLTCEACGGDWQQALPAASAIELLHNFSLIHDDIEDKDERRRGRPTPWAVWGQAQAINAGDTLFALAQLALLRLTEQGLPPDSVVAALRVFNRTCVALTGGQYLDIDFESRSHVSIPDYVAMIEGKTAALSACSCEMGALVAAAPDPAREHLRFFGHHLGLAFQIRDDILGIWGHPALTGKPAGADIARHKKTLPIIHGLKQGLRLHSSSIREPLSPAQLRRATRLLEEVGSREHTEQLAREQHTKAIAALEAANLQGCAAEALHEMARTLLTRSR